MSRSTPQINSDKPLGGRYKVISQLGAGGFGRTFLAEDLHLPGHPRCVVKQLKPHFKSDDTLQMARRCFNTEAQVLYQLGNYDQIPRLLAHFEDRQEFYLAQEFVAGTSLTAELLEGQPWSEAKVVEFLEDVLRILTFVHQQQVIHRDLKPSNLIRRQPDQKIVLIDFGAVKQVGVQNYDVETGLTNLTISIGTQGYMPNEQLAGKPRFSSDIYAVGIIAIQALTGIHPRYFEEDEKGEIAWRHRAAHVHSMLMDILDRMVRYDFRDRYPTTTEVIQALAQLPPLSDEPPPPFQPPRRSSEINLTESKPHSLNSQSHRETDYPSTVTQKDEFSANDVTVAGEEGVPTAIWLNADSGVPPIPPSGTGLTQAIGRPYPEEAQIPTSAPAPVAKGVMRQFSKPLTLLAILISILTVGLAAVALQNVMPELFANRRSGQTPDSTPTPTVPLLTSTNSVELVTYGAQLLQKQDYAQALKYYDRAIEVKPDNASAYAGRCETLNHLKRPEEAIVSCNDALAYQPNYPEALWSKGNALLQQGRTYEALKLYEDVTYLKGNFAPAWVKKGVALQALGRSAEAVYALDQAIALQRNSAEAWSTRGAALYRLQRYDEALVSLDKALQLQNPDDPQTVQLRQQAKAKIKS